MHSYHTQKHWSESTKPSILMAIKTSCLPCTGRPSCISRLLPRSTTTDNFVCQKFRLVEKLHRLQSEIKALLEAYKFVNNFNIQWKDSKGNHNQFFLLAWTLRL